MRSGNPVLRDDSFSGRALTAERMTVQGTVGKTAVLLLLALGGASAIWARAVANPADPAVALGLLGGALGGFVLAIVTVFKKDWARYTAPVYALLEGVFLGGITAFFEVRYPGVAINAVLLTFGTCAVMLALYRAGVVRATEKFRTGVLAATGAIALVYLASIVLGFFGVNLPLLNDATPLGIGISVVIVIVAALNLVLDFDFIEQGARAGAPKHLEWFGAFALTVTLVWLYLEILRLLSKLQRR